MRTEHNLKHGHGVLFSPTMVLAKSTSYGKGVISESLEIQVESRALNQDMEPQLNDHWKPVICLPLSAFKGWP